MEAAENRARLIEGVWKSPLSSKVVGSSFMGLPGALRWQELPLKARVTRSRRVG